MGETKISNIPNFLKASTPEKLRELMLFNNLRLKSFIKYQDISELSDGSFICWYYEEFPIENLLKPSKDKKPKG